MTTSTLPKGAFTYTFNDGEYELEGHYSNVIVEEIGNIFPDNGDLIQCSVSSTCNAAIEDLRPDTQVICNKNDMTLVAKEKNKKFWYISHHKIVGKISKKIKTTITESTSSLKTGKWDDVKI
jgi:hypothetical protein